MVLAPLGRILEENSKMNDDLTYDFRRGQKRDRATEKKSTKCIIIYAQNEMKKIAEKEKERKAEQIKASEKQ